MFVLDSPVGFLTKKALLNFKLFCAPIFLILPIILDNSLPVVVFSLHLLSSSNLSKLSNFKFFIS